MWFRIQLIVLFSLLLFLISWPILHVPEKAYAQYQELLESSDPSRKGGLLSYSQQERQGVKKEIWYRTTQPLNIHIESEKSEVFFFHDEKHVEIVEQLENVFCVMQEELYYLLPDGKEAIPKEGKLIIRGSKNVIVPFSDAMVKMQEVRYLEAAKACYNYNSQLFLAQNATIRKYKIKGHQPRLSFENETPLLSGKAESVEMTIKEKKIDFQAHHLKATFNSKDDIL